MFVYHSSQITKIDIGIKSTHSPILDFYPRKSAQMFNFPYTIFVFQKGNTDISI